MKKKILILTSTLIILSVFTSCGAKDKEKNETNSSKKESIQVSTKQSTEESKVGKTDTILTSTDFLGKSFSGTATEGAHEYSSEIAFGVDKLNYENTEGDLLYMRVGQTEGLFEVYDRLTFTPSNEGIHVSAKFIGNSTGVDFKIVKGDNQTYLFYF